MKKQVVVRCLVSLLVAEILTLFLNQILVNIGLPWLLPGHRFREVRVYLDLILAPGMFFLIFAFVYRRVRRAGWPAGEARAHTCE